MGVSVDFSGGHGQPLLWTDIPYSAGNFTAQAGSWNVALADQKTFRYMLNGKFVAVCLTLDGGATTAIATDLFVALPAIITPLREIRGFMLTNASGASEAGFYYIDANVATIKLRRIAGTWPINAAFQVAVELFLEIA